MTKEDQTLAVTIGVPIIRLDATSSTMDSVADLATQGAPAGLAVVAKEQTAGQGRQQRTWVSPKGAGIYCSFLLRPFVEPEQFSAMSVVAGLSICEAVERLFPLKPKLKWPNDVFLCDRKLAGVLIRTEICDSLVTTAIVGFGINLFKHRDGPKTSVALADLAQLEDSSGNELLSAVFAEISRRNGLMMEGQLSEALGGWQQRALYLGEPVSLLEKCGALNGIFEGIDHSGALLLRSGNGTVTAIHTGEVVRGPVRTSSVKISR
jgi:BirA family transcriptional regulator, biotin operon repressor / biotin---[acetyl-CoA-carboxylase] ligase